MFRMGLVKMNTLFAPIFAILLTCPENSSSGSPTAIKSTSECEEPVAAEDSESRQLAERIFVAYIDGKVKSYEVIKMACGSDLNYHFRGIGEDAGFGRDWRIRINTNNLQITIFPGK